MALTWKKCAWGSIGLLVALGCGGKEANRGDTDTSAASSDDGTNASSSSSTATTGNSSSGGGTSSATSTSTATGGTAGASSTAVSSTSGGNSSSSTTNATSGGGSGGRLAADQCRSVADCDVVNDGASDTRCASPYEPAGNTVVCGAPGWCGQCDCPIQAPDPQGRGYPCDTDDDCTAWDDTPNASLCRDGQCVVCESDDDCSEERPHCGTQMVDFSSYYNTCLECVLDEDCPAERPRCLYADGVGMTCVECFNTSDCATGVCSLHACVPGCTSDDDCSNPALACGADERCASIPCTSNDDCPDNTSCSDQTCSRRSCTSDADCEGVCVNSVCYETYGTCSTTYYAP